MKLALDQRIPGEYSKSVFTDLFRKVQESVNGLAEERLAAHYGGRTAVPTTGSWAKGDFVRNSSPAEAGGGGSMYVILGWVCVASGAPGTWKQCRVLTGN